jgi:hypothetical protein
MIETQQLPQLTIEVVEATHRSDQSSGSFRDTPFWLVFSMAVEHMILFLKSRSVRMSRSMIVNLTD